MSGSSGKVGETSAQKALAQHAQNLMQDYQTRWLPVQQNLAAQIEGEGKPNSWQRAEAKGKASTDSAIQFDQAQGALQKSLTNHGAMAGSGRFDMAVAGGGSDQARSSGLNQVVSDQRISQAYTEGLGALTQIGQGQATTVNSGLEDQARNSALQAKADAQASLEGRESTMGAVGSLVGLAAGAWNPTPAVGMGSDPNGYNGTQNNPSAYVAH